MRYRDILKLKSLPISLSLGSAYVSLTVRTLSLALVWSSFVSLDCYTPSEPRRSCRGTCRSLTSLTHSAVYKMSVECAVEFLNSFFIRKNRKMSIFCNKLYKIFDEMKSRAILLSTKRTLTFSSRLLAIESLSGKNITLKSSKITKITKSNCFWISIR